MSRLGLLLVAVLAPAIYACHGKGGGADTPAGIYCHATVGTETVCYGYSNLDADEKTAVSDACTTSLRGTISGSCPSGMLGCCSTSTSGYQTTECYYAGPASAYQEGCESAGGKWSGGSSSSGPDTTGSNPDGGSRPGTDSGEDSGFTSGPMGSCQPGQTQCPLGCVDEGTDVNNCGSCGYACPAGPHDTTPTCSGGKCAYLCADQSETLCGYGNDPNAQDGQCVDLQSDPENCGQCGNYCQASGGAEAQCQGGVCQTSCPAGQGLCSGECIDITSDPSNCGGCGVNCGANTVCTNGACVAGCSDGGTLCNGTCTSLQTDANNCGSCGNQCPLTAASCESGTCACEVYCVDQFDSPYCCMGTQQCYMNGCM